MASTALSWNVVSSSRVEVSPGARPQGAALMADLHLGLLLAMAIIVFGFVVGNVETIALSLLAGVLGGIVVAAVQVRRKRL